MQKWLQLRRRHSPADFSDYSLLASGLLPDGVMIDVALSILALIAGGLTLELFGAAWPPLGCQEERDFKLAADVAEVAEEFQSGNPS